MWTTDILARDRTSKEVKQLAPEVLYTSSEDWGLSQSDELNRLATSDSVGVRGPYCLASR